MKSGPKPYTHIQEGVIDHNAQLIILFSPRAGCTIGYKMFFEHLGLLTANLHDRIELHKYRYTSFHKKNGSITKHLLNSYTVAKLVRNPYARAVSSFTFIIVEKLVDYFSLSFYDFLLILKTNAMKFIYKGKENAYISRHAMIQYDQDEEHYLNAIIKLEQAQSDLDEKINGPLNLHLRIDDKNSNHHSPRIPSTEKLMYEPITSFADQLPTSYKDAFYDDRIKLLVEELYGIDIEKYHYSFEESF